VPQQAITWILIYIYIYLNPTSCQKVWEVTLDFIKAHEEDSQEVMGMISMREREWIQSG